MFQHPGKLFSFFRAGRLMINLCDKSWLAFDRTNYGFASTAEFRAQFDAFSAVVDERALHYSPLFVKEASARLASTSVLSSSVFSFTRGDARNAASDSERSFEQPSLAIRSGANSPLKNGSCAIRCW